MSEDDEAVLALAVRSLVARLPRVPEPLLRTYAEQALATYADATVRTYLSILVGRKVTDDISAASWPQAPVDVR